MKKVNKKGWTLGTEFLEPNWKMDGEITNVIGGKIKQIPRFLHIEITDLLRYLPQTLISINLNLKKIY